MTDPKKILPQLRFPEFANAGEWETPTISEIFEIRNGYTPSKSESAYWDGGTIPWFRMEDIRENGGILSDSIQHITSLGVKGKGLFKKNSIILATTATIGIHAMIIADSLANQRFTNFSIRESLNHLYSPKYIYYAFYEIDEWCKRNTNAGGLLSVNMSALLKKTFYTPTLAEQQKIAECLSSIDEQILATQQKWDSLKEHKRGLMQKLFPANGKTTPDFRFPEFANAGEWEEKKLGEVAEKKNTRNRNLFVSRVLSNSATEGIVDQNTYFGRNIAVKENTENYYVVDFNDFVYNPRISTLAPVGPISINKIGKGIMSPIYIIFRFKKGMFVDYWKHYFSTSIWHKYLKGIANFGARFDRMNITNEDFFNMPLLIPSLAEQQKIAECLSSLDELITAQAQKAEALKEHKRGLMQKLFPTNAKS